MSNLINLGSLNISKCYLGASDTRLYLGDTLVYPISSQPKYVLTQSDSSIVSGTCNGQPLTSGETAQYSATTVSAVVGECATLGERAFQSFRNLSAVTLHDGITSIPYLGFYECSGLTGVTLPSGLTSIGQGAFHKCGALTSVTIPATIQSIGMQAFANCTGLTSITVLATTPPTLSTGVFTFTADSPIFVPSGSVSAYQQAPNWDYWANRIQAIV